MPLEIPTLDNRKYQDLLDEALARIPVHNPEWTNFNKSDPGVTLIEVFAFLTESLLYRANQIPERNRRKFLSLLGIPLQPATSAQGIVAFANERGPLETLTLNRDLEVRAGQVPFRTTMGLDLLPVEGKLYYKRSIQDPPAKLVSYYNQLYSSYTGGPSRPTTMQLYETVPFTGQGAEGLDLGQQTVDGSLWIALLARPRENVEDARKAIEGRVLSLGVVPVREPQQHNLTPTGRPGAEGSSLLRYEVPVGGVLPANSSERVANYKTLDASPGADVLAQPGIVQIELPPAEELVLWSNLDPLEAGVGDFPPALEDTRESERLITWLRVRATAGVRAKLLWAGINATQVTQRARIANELLPEGTGEPDQAVKLSRTPVIPASVRVTVTNLDGVPEEWQEIDDMLSAGPEVPVTDLRQPPGSPPLPPRPSNVFTVNAESGEVRFGDGLRGKRPPLGARIRASYDFGVGRSGNVGARAINSSPALPSGITVTNPVRTWGGAEAETVREGEKQISRYLQHRDRLVTAADFKTIASRTPGVDIGRLEVLPAFHPELSPNQPGDAPGAVTLMAIPRYEPFQPDPSGPDLFLDAICTYLDPRRLVTTEVFLRRPRYKPVWVSVGISVVPGVSIALVREEVKKELLRYLSPLPDPQLAASDATPQQGLAYSGWPLGKKVVDRELLAVASRVRGVMMVNDLILSEGTGGRATDIGMRGLELPQVMGISVADGDPLPLGQAAPQATTSSSSSLPVPVVPEECD